MQIRPLSKSSWSLSWDFRRKRNSVNKISIEKPTMTTNRNNEKSGILILLAKKVSLCWGCLSGDIYNFMLTTSFYIDLFFNKIIIYN